MELRPGMVRRAHRLDEEALQKVVAAAAEDITEWLAGCTLLGQPIDFDDEDWVLVAAYYLGQRDLSDLEMDDGLEER